MKKGYAYRNEGGREEEHGQVRDLLHLEGRKLGEEYINARGDIRLETPSVKWLKHDEKINRTSTILHSSLRHLMHPLTVLNINRTKHLKPSNDQNQPSHQIIPHSPNSSHSSTSYPASSSNFPTSQSRSTNSRTPCS